MGVFLRDNFNCRAGLAQWHGLAQTLVTAFLLMKGLLCKQSMHKSEGCYSHMPPINITVEGVQKLLDKLNPYKAPGPDNLQPRILRELSCQIGSVLCNIFKVSVKTGTVPDDWKLANVTPIHKKGLRQLPENYRPVSLTCTCCKLMENILVSHISRHLDRHSILNDSQHGFRQAQSCETQLCLYR